MRKKKSVCSVRNDGVAGRPMQRQAGGRLVMERMKASEKAQSSGWQSRGQEAGVCGFAAEGAVEGDEGELGGGGKGAEIGVGPVFGGGTAEAGQAAEDPFEAGRLIKAGNAIILQPAIVGLPRLRLIHDFVGHDRCRSEEAEKTELCETAEKEAGVRRKNGKPGGGTGMMDVALVGEGDPDVEIREKK
jgi:hypothetical protein